MKKSIVLLTIILITNSVWSQTDSTKTNSSKKDSSFVGEILKKIQIGQSMETSDERGEPAQLQITIPHKDTVSYLINFGLSIGLDCISTQKLISKLKTEYHRNTMTDKKQNNFEIGYQGTWSFVNFDKTRFFVVFDPKYVYDGIDIKNSFASNIIFSWFRKNSDLNWNTNNYFHQKNEALFLSLFLGTQIQNIFNAKVDSAKGFIVRPLYSTNISYTINKVKKDIIPIIKFSLTYSGRYDMINNTKISEGYTQSLKTGVDIYLANDPFKISLGASYNYGSDPIIGQALQKFWLISINISK